jgi:coenzyme F420-0:L-glutamate ligase/coenzyme F420-1:gamma-L-glutamate ligase
VADELASAAELAQGKLAGRPCAVVRGRADLVLAPDDDGPGAATLVRPEGGDLFGFGAREAVLRALAADPADQPVFGSPVPVEELADALSRLAPGTEQLADGSFRLPVAAARAVVEAAVFAHGWVVASYEPGPEGAGVRLRPRDT